MTKLKKRMKKFHAGNVAMSPYLYEAIFKDNPTTSFKMVITPFNRTTSDKKKASYICEHVISKTGDHYLSFTFGFNQITEEFDHVIAKINFDDVDSILSSLIFKENNLSFNLQMRPDIIHISYPPTMELILSKEIELFLAITDEGVFLVSEYHYEPHFSLNCSRNNIGFQMTHHSTSKDILDKGFPLVFDSKAIYEVWSMIYHIPRDFRPPDCTNARSHYESILLK